MSLGAGEPASETGDDSLSAVTSGSDLETKTKRPSFHKPPPTSPKSPYHAKPGNVAPWRSRRTATSMPLSSRVSLTPQKLWLGTCKPGRVPGTPVYREKEDMYNEIIELKKSLHVQKSDVDLMRTKVRRLEEDNSRKDRQIEQLLDPTRGTDFVRTLADKRPDTGWVVTGLRQRILKLEQQCREKDNTISKLQTDMKTTNLEEMRIAMETYYEEVHRLQILLATSEAAGKKLPVERKTGLKRQQKMGGVLLNLSRSMQELTEENQSLKEDLDRLLSGSPPISKIKGPSGADPGEGATECHTLTSVHACCPRYMEWSKPRLLRHITELEKKISSLESPKSHALELVKPGSRPPSSRCTAHRQPPADLQEGPERLRAALKGFRGEQAALYTQLQEKDLEVKQLLQTKADLERELEQVKGSEKEGREREEALREQVETLTRKLRELHERQRDKEEALVGMAQEPQEDLQLPVPSSSCSPEASEADCSAASSRPPSAHSAGSGEEGQRDTAARVLQAQWRARQHKKKEAALDEEATVLQAAFRGHRARAQLLASRACGSPSPSTPSPPRKCPATPHSQSPTAPDGTGLEEAILLVQSVFRAHLARTRPGAISERTTTTAPARRTSASTANRDASSPPALVASAQDDSEASSVESVEGSAAEEEALTPGDPAIAEPTLSRSQAAVPSPTEEAPSDDSDDIISPSLPRKKSSSP